MLWSLHDSFCFSLSLELQGTSMPSCALSLSHLKLVCSGSATLDLATAQTRLSSAPSLEHWTWRLHCCFAGTKNQHGLDISVDLTWHLLDHLHMSLHLCILHDFLITPVRERNLLGFLSFLHCLCAAVFWHCISAGTSTFMSMYC